MRSRSLALFVLPLVVSLVACTARTPEEPAAAESAPPAEAPPPASGLAARHLRCEYLVDPLGIDETSPRLSWEVASAQRGQTQTAYRILVASSPEALAAERGDRWDSGRVDSDLTSQIVYEGSPLRTGDACWWKVRVWDRAGEPSAWSPPASWTMGLLEPGDWKAAWIGYDGARGSSEPEIDESVLEAKWIWSPDAGEGAVAPAGVRFFRASFDVPEGREVVSATCTAAVDNGGLLFLNGEQIASVNSFKEASQLEVTEAVRPGRNVLAIQASNAGEEANPAGVIAAVRVEVSGGEPITLLSGDGWKSATEEVEGWAETGHDDSGWSGVVEVGTAGGPPWGDLSVRSARLRLPPVPMLRRAFDVREGLRRATLHATALGIYELEINGMELGMEFFEPGWTDYDRRVHYRTYDVTVAVHEGPNAIGAFLADGWYCGYIGWGRERDHFGTAPRLRAQLTLEYEDGSREVVGTDGAWRASTGPILEADFLMGETYDARLEHDGWSSPGFDDSGWSPVQVSEGIDVPIEAHPGVPVRSGEGTDASTPTIRFVDPVAVTEPKPGVHVYDLGQNFAGFVKLSVEQPAGTEITLRFAERLDEDGMVYTTNLRGARATDRYICRGGGLETWEPRFTFHGFQYVELTGVEAPGPGAVTGIALSSDTPVVGSFECSDPVANRLYSNIVWTQRANFIDIPTDCPQRDERLGWTGDAQIYIRTATYNTDVASFFTKWLVDLVDARLPDGAFPDVAPRRIAVGGGTAAWADAGTICPWTVYQVYGDRRVLERHYDAMAGWIAYCEEHSTDLLRPAEGYGDWLSIRADTPKDVLATAYFAQSTSIMAQVAEVLGRDEDVVRYRDLLGRIRGAFRDAYVSPDGRVRGDTQTVYVLALAFDLLPEEQRSLALGHLIADIEKRGDHLSTGFVGTKDLMQVLTRFGRTDVAYRLFEQTTFPGWRFSIGHGATSIWERWDGWTPEKGFQDPGMNSFAHYSFGAVGEWMFRTVAGIDTLDAGFGRLRIRPRPGGSLEWARASYHSIRGPVSTEWRLEEGALRLDVELPANTSAEVWIPAAGVDAVTEGDGPLAGAEGIRSVRVEEGAVVCDVGSGRYSFLSRVD